MLSSEGLCHKTRKCAYLIGPHTRLEARLITHHSECRANPTKWTVFATIQASIFQVRWAEKPVFLESLLDPLDMVPSEASCITRYYAALYVALYSRMTSICGLPQCSGSIYTACIRSLDSFFRSVESHTLTRLQIPSSDIPWHPWHFLTDLGGEPRVLA